MFSAYFFLLEIHFPGWEEGRAVVECRDDGDSYGGEASNQGLRRAWVAEIVMLGAKKGAIWKIGIGEGITKKWLYVSVLEELIKWEKKARIPAHVAL